MPEIIELKLDEVNTWQKKEIGIIINPLRTEAKKVLEDIKLKLEELSEACEKLLDDAEKEMAKGSRKTYRRAKFLYKLANTFLELIEKITFPEKINGKTLNETLESITKTIKTIGQEKTKWFRAISPYFILSRRRFEVSFKRTEDTVHNFSDFLSKKYSEASKAEGINPKVNDIRKYLIELKKYEKDKNARRQRKNFLENEILENKQKLQSIQNKDELIELTKINMKIEDLTKKVKYELRHIQKPLLKFYTMVNNPGYNLPPDTKIKLDEYLENPFIALATEKQGYLQLITILTEINTALDNKKMKLKPSRLRKAKDQITRILNKSSLMPLYKESCEVFLQKKQLTTSKALNETKNKKIELNNQLKILIQKKRLLEAKDSRLIKKYDETSKKVTEKKKKLEQIMSDISHKKIQLILD